MAQDDDPQDDDPQGGTESGPVAGRTRQLEVPERFLLALQPWPGAGNSYEVEARLRWRLHDGKLHIGYRLERIDEVVAQAVTDLTEHLSAALPKHLVLAGSPPAPLSPVTDTTRVH